MAFFKGYGQKNNPHLKTNGYGKPLRGKTERGRIFHDESCVNPDKSLYGYPVFFREFLKYHAAPWKQRLYLLRRPNICVSFPHRSEERRVGKECRSRWS